ncbi:hypothetical protein [Marilutibacter maris]|nr:hypothetical protein [Lysobacter maris]
MSRILELQKMTATSVDSVEEGQTTSSNNSCDCSATSVNSCLIDGGFIAV